MAIRDFLPVEVLRDAVLHLGFRERNLPWDPEKINNLAAGLRAVKDNAVEIATSTDADLLDAVDEVIRRFHPNHETWSDPKLKELLEKKAALLEAGASKEPVDKTELHVAFEFATELWIVISAHEQKLQNGIW